MVAGDTDDFDAGLGKPLNALFQLPVSLEEIVFPFDYVTGKQDCPDAGIDGNLYGVFPGAGRTQVAGLLREFFRQPGGRPPKCISPTASIFMGSNPVQTKADKPGLSHSFDNDGNSLADTDAHGNECITASDIFQLT